MQSTCIPCSGQGAYPAYYDLNGNRLPAAICQFCGGTGEAPACTPGECGLGHPSEDCGAVPTREMLDEYLAEHPGEPYPPGYYRVKQTEDLTEYRYERDPRTGARIEHPTVRLEAVSVDTEIEWKG